VIQHIKLEAVVPPPDQINRTITLCYTICCYRAINRHLPAIMARSTNDLIIPITTMSKHHVDLPLPITVGEYNAIAHLTYISAFTDLIETYLVNAVKQEDEPPSLLQHITSAAPSPSHIFISSDDDEMDHPEGEWMLYDGKNPKHYVKVQDL
jgi:hypothetical protein